MQRQDAATAVRGEAELDEIDAVRTGLHRLSVGEHQGRPIIRLRRDGADRDGEIGPGHRQAGQLGGDHFGRAAIVAEDRERGRLVGNAHDVSEFDHSVAARQDVGGDRRGQEALVERLLAVVVLRRLLSAEARGGELRRVTGGLHLASERELIGGEAEAEEQVRVERLGGGELRGQTVGHVENEHGLFQVHAYPFDRDTSTFIVETVQGGAGIVAASESYWKGVRQLCDRYGVVWLADEVQCGVGRTGKFFAFEHYGVVPDIVTLAKSLGGGKTALGAYIARRDIHMKAYGPSKVALIHGPATFSGMGEGCITAIEALNVLYDENLIDNSAAMGARLLAGLKALQQRHPKVIKEVRGLGLMVGIEFADLSDTLPFGVRQMVSLLDEKLKGSLCGFAGTLMLRDYNTLVAFTEYNRNVIRLEPPLIAGPQHIDEFLRVFGELLDLGVTKIVSKYARGAVAAA